jgi:hypothetical protein
MAITAQSIIQRAVQILQDTSSVRWPVDELVRWLNDGQRQIVLHRPDSNSITATGTLAAGTRQSLTTMTGISSSNPAKLIDVVRNMAATSQKKAVRMVAREILDAQQPGWHAATQSVDIVHFMFDARDPRAFYVYPPATTAAQLEIIFSAYPTDVAAPTGSDYTSVTGNIGVLDIYANALLDYILYRAYLKDADYAGDAARAQACFQAFATSLGLELSGTVSNAPVTAPGNPNTGKAG